MSEKELDLLTKEKIERIQEKLNDLKSNLNNIETNEVLSENINSLVDIVKNFINQIIDLSFKDKKLKDFDKVQDLSNVVDLQSKFALLKEDTIKLLNLCEEIKKDVQFFNFKKIISLNTVMDSYEKAFNCYLLNTRENDWETLESIKKSIFDDHLQLDIKEKKAQIIILFDGSVIFLTPKNYIFYFKKEELISGLYISIRDKSWVNKKEEEEFFKIELTESYFRVCPHLDHLTSFGFFIDAFIEGLKHSNFAVKEYQNIKKSLLNFMKCMDNYELRFINYLFRGIFWSHTFSEEWIRDAVLELTKSGEKWGSTLCNFE